MPRYVEMPCPLGLGADTLFVGLSQDASAFQPYSLTRRPSSFAARALAYCVSLRVVGQGSRKVSTVSCLICISYSPLGARELIPSEELSTLYPVPTLLAVYTAPCALDTFIQTVLWTATDVNLALATSSHSGTPPKTEDGTRMPRPINDEE
jgi:hypothetical protein